MEGEERERGEGYEKEGECTERNVTKPTSRMHYISAKLLDSFGTLKRGLKRGVKHGGAMKLRWDSGDAPGDAGGERLRTSARVC